MPLLIADRYEISDKRIGAGAFGEVWLGTDLQTNATVAVKLAAKPSPQVSAQAIDDSFRREEEALQNIVHPNVVALLDSGFYDNRRFLVLEYVKGETLWDIYKREQTNASLTMAAKIRMLSGLASGLNEIHSNGFVHLDVKPENVLVAQAGRSVLIDFGSCLPTRIARSRPAEIETTAYCAPEQVQGSRWCDGKGLTPKTDVFAFGIVSWEILTLKRPFGDASTGQTQRIADDNPEGNLQKLAPSCPPELVGLIQYCLNKNPNGRPAMQIVAQRLQTTAALLESQTLYRNGRIEEALIKIEEAIEASPDLQEARDLAFEYSKAHISALTEKGDVERAQEIVKRARDHCSGDPERISYLAKVESTIDGRLFRDRKIAQFLDVARRDLEKGNHDAAAQYVAMAEKVDPSHILLQQYHRRRYGRCEDYLRVQDYAQALKFWEDIHAETLKKECFPGATAEVDRLWRRIWKLAGSDIEDALFRYDFDGANRLLNLLRDSSSSEELAGPQIAQLTQTVANYKASYAEVVQTENNKLVSAGKYDQALEHMERALLALPGDARLASAKAELVQNIEQTQSQIQSIQDEIDAGETARAQELIAQARASRNISTEQLNQFERRLGGEQEVLVGLDHLRRLIADENLEDAAQYLDQLLQLHSADFRLIRAKADLDARLDAIVCTQLADEIEAALAQGDVDAAALKSQEAQYRFPQDRRIDGLALRIERLQAAQREEEERRQRELHMEQELAESLSPQAIKEPVLLAEDLPTPHQEPAAPHVPPPFFDFPKTFEASPPPASKAKSPPAAPPQKKPSVPPKRQKPAERRAPADLGSKAAVVPRRDAKPKPPLNQLYLWVGAGIVALIFLGILGWELFGPPSGPKVPTMAQVMIDSSPSGATILVEGGGKSLFCVTPRCALSLPAGPYTAKATLDNYQTATQTFNAAPGMAPIQFSLAVSASAGSNALLVIQTPGAENSTIFVDGKKYSTSGTEFSFPATLNQTYQVHAVKDGYDASQDQPVTVAQARQTLRILLKPSADAATLIVSKAMPGAQVLVDDALVGKVDGRGGFQATVTPGTHNVQLANGGLTSPKETAQFASRARVEIADLVIPTPPAFATLNLSNSTANASVLIDGNNAGTVGGGGSFQTKVPPGPHTVMLTMGGVNSNQASRQFNANDTVNISLTVAVAPTPPAFATLNLSNSTANASVLIDGNNAGTVGGGGSFQTKVPPGPHTVMLTMGGVNSNQASRQFNANDTVNISLIVAATRPTPPPVDNALLDQQKWDSVKNSGNQQQLQSYLNEFPQGKYVNEARTVINSLQRRSDEAGVRAAIERYTQAFNSKNINQVRSAWPNISKKDADNDQQTFKLASAIQMTQQVNSIKITGNAAEADCLQTTYLTFEGHKGANSNAKVFLLERSSGGWVIDNIK